MGALDEVMTCGPAPGCNPTAQGMAYPPLLCECGYPEPAPTPVPDPPVATGAGDSGPDRIAITFDMPLMEVPINTSAFVVTGSTPDPAPAVSSAYVSAPGVVTVVFAAPVTFTTGTVTYTVPAAGTGLIRSRTTGTPAESFTLPIA